MQYSKSAFGPIPARVAGANRNSDNGWGNYQWSPGGKTRVPANLLGWAEYKGLRLQIRRELVPLTELMWQIADELGYEIHSTNPNGNGENWGPWGYSDRPIGGTQSPSNHSRGRAEDDNAPYNPMVSAFITDMDPEYVAAREECGFYWGGRYNGKTDTMHFEYVGRPEDVAADERRARQILQALRERKAAANKPTPSQPATPATPAAPTPAPTPKDWFDMATQQDLISALTGDAFRNFLRAELRFIVNEDERADQGSLKGAVLAMANKSATELNYAYATIAANTTSADEFQRQVDALTEVAHSEGISGAGDLGRLRDALVPALNAAGQTDAEAVADAVVARLGGAQ